MPETYVYGSGLCADPTCETCYPEHWDDGDYIGPDPDVFCPQDESDGDEYYDLDEEDGDYGGEGEESPDPLAEPTPLRPDTPLLYLPVLPGREIRLMSFEQEVSRGRAAVRLASGMCQAGYSPWSDIASYGSGGRAQREHAAYGTTFVHVEEDGSCGGEVIYSMLRLNQEDVARRVTGALTLAREIITEEDALSTSCGFHIHVDLHGYGMAAVENLYHLHNIGSCEDEPI